MDEFYDRLPLQTAFGTLSDQALYTPLPDDWLVGTSDIVGSTQAIAQGRYKTVNMIGAAVISAQINAAQGRAFPFVFGGDGAAFACPPQHAEAAQRALGAVRCWAGEEFDMQLRVAMVPVSVIRNAGREVAVARYQAAQGVDYAMFTGGGISWAEAEMKRGQFDLPHAPAGTQPDLTGLSCRWSQMKARNGQILSVLIQPEEGADDTAVADLIRDVLKVVGDLERNGHPAPVDGPGAGWPPAGAEMEARATHGKMTVAKRKRQILFESFLAWLLIRTGLKIGGFDARSYARSVGENADFRKFDDGLKMTLDCDDATAARLGEMLEAARKAGTIRYGLHSQSEAMMTCIVPSMMRDDHVHFIDGAAGGYTQAATQIKGGSV
ncbi:DUF3095 domain-containing protein [Pseudosulfitobacter sp. DSM 107133]|uniref:DUF3095 domain-containing protein n=1 Tax=Pseudosulfitobacter sp. DSM 107133 TaxID=2883100 RepID=UPI000DF39CE8|nr:DUF3095 domain-containing protein [Pseudosulfitobacter sp. DSM 107133]UOA28731.1 hypothetical protein DSM107133_03489 [Pseudosulfitobacter sp. DSM 107133]